MILGVAIAVILVAFLFLKIIKGTLGFVLHGFGWVIAIALIFYWYHKDHSVASPTVASAYESPVRIG